MSSIIKFSLCWRYAFSIFKTVVLAKQPKVYVTLINFTVKNRSWSCCYRRDSLKNKGFEKFPQ